ncbi:hypothetical protein RG47T_5023 [Mucilaginibacter polytrichastri]|uniref:Uncharacterized protein n=1 Tax=Mucilaginibacter polytrichastri TaxID=1302689 RepID=A0A1Q6A6B3_9SPHI|nr:hypothetical protein RG47T_5023 [Mucilaginibacter polytrichastri]
MLANPADTQLHIDELKSLMSQYPQSNLLHVLAAKGGNGQFAGNAAVYYNGESLYKLTNNNEPLPAVNTAQVVNLDTAVFKTASFAESVIEEPIAAQDAPIEAQIQVEHVDNTPELETNAPAVEEMPVVEKAIEENVTPEPVAEEPVAEPEPGLVGQDDAAAVPEPTLSDWQPTPANINPPAEPLFYASNYKAEEPAPVEDVKPAAPEPVVNTAPVVSEWQAVRYEDVAVNNNGEHHPEAQKEAEPAEDEVYDEIVSIDDIYIAPIAVTEQAPAPAVAEEPYYTNYTEQRNDEVIIPAPTTPKPEFNLEDQITESIYATDYFAFKDALLEEPAVQPEQQVAQLEAAQADENQTMAKYHDDNLPYSFLWWLDKTRREHANMYQPYAKPSALPAMESLADEKEALGLSLPDTKHKEEEIIERFIQAEPQIKPPAGDKLDNENKARNSAEDSDELVTETLARIYIDQMLYPKAIATYKKLMLRYPEKSSYFAGQIENLENKIN